MKTPSLSIVLSFTLFANCAADAAVVAQTFDLSATFHEGPSPPGEFFTNSLAAIAQPFDSNLGTLNSATVTWDITMSIVVTATNTSSSSLSFSFGGSTYVNDVDYGGFGGCGGTGGPSGSTANDLDHQIYTYTFLPTDTDDYLMEIWSILTGPSEFELSAVNLDESFASYIFLLEAADATVAFDQGSSVSIMYDFTAVPEPSSLLFFGGIVLFSLRRRRRL